MNEQELEAIRAKGMASAVEAVEKFTAKVREFGDMHRSEIMNALVRVLVNDLPKPTDPPEMKRLVACGLLAAAITLLAEERNKREKS